MKKTIIALMALAGVVCAGEYTGKFDWEAKNTPSFTLNAGVQPDIELLITGMNINDSAVNFTTAAPKTNSVYAGTLTPDVNIGNGGNYDFSFSITNKTEEALTIFAITFDTFAYNNGGAAQSADFLKREITFTLTGDASAEIVHSFTNIDAETDVYNWDTNPTLYFDSIEIAAGATANFNLAVEKSDSVGCFIGISGATVIPEPTTATLSLLALAGLAARRRRASC